MNAEHERLADMERQRNHWRDEAGRLSLRLRGVAADKAEAVRAGRAEGVTVTEWRINGADGEPSFAIDQRDPSAEYWTRKVAAMSDDRWPESRQVTTYQPTITEWTRAEAEQGGGE